MTEETSLFPNPLVARAIALLAAAQAKGMKIATAESCTGGLIAALLTEIPGSSSVVERGFVTYSNEAKIDLLGVDADVIATHGAVSEPVARVMAVGALANSRADVAVSVTGIAGPGGDTDDKPVGLVWFGLARRGHAVAALEKRFGDIGRGQVRLATVRAALELLEGAVRSQP